MYEDYDYLFKVLVTGDSGAGKSCLMMRFTDDVFSTNYICTIGVDFRVRQVKLDDKSCRIQIWDTAGQERFKSIINQYYRGANGVIVVYDITDMQSFLNVKKWLKEADDHSTKFLSKLLVGNKSDLNSKRIVSYENGQELADSLGIPFMETSAKNSENVGKAFMSMCADIKSHIPSSSSDREPTKIKFDIGKTSTVKKVLRKGPCDC